MNRSDIEQWHIAAKFPITQEVLANRCKALKAILEQKGNSYWIDIVKLFLGLTPDPKTESSFVKQLQSNDETFPRLKIEKQVVVQAAIALSCKIQLALDFIAGIKPTPKKVVTPTVGGEAESSEDEDEEGVKVGEEDVENAWLICFALENASFHKQIKIDTKVGLVEKINEFRSKFKSSDRLIDNTDHDELLSEIETDLEEEEELETAQQLQLTKALRSQIKTSKIRSEELDILWWLFGEYSELGTDYFGKINSNALAVLIAKEVHDLCPFNTEIPAARHIFRKALIIGRTESDMTPVTVKDCFDALSPEQKKNIISDYEGKICELTPCLNALKTGREFAKSKETKKTDDSTLSRTGIAMQVYRELNFLRAI